MGREKERQGERQTDWDRQRDRGEAEGVTERQGKRLINGGRQKER
jgi:hypothetical protein